MIVRLLTLMGLMLGPVLAAEPVVVLSLLDPSGKQQPIDRFWIDWLKEWRGVTARKKLTGEQATEIATQLKESLSSTPAEHFCGHDPIYGVVALREDGKELKTSLCFRCLTWVQPGKRLAIRGSREWKTISANFSAVIWRFPKNSGNKRLLHPPGDLLVGHAAGV